MARIRGFAGGAFINVDQDDTTPIQFEFTDQNNVARSTIVTSNQITVTGIDAPAPISIIGGEYSRNGGEYTSESGTVESGDTVTVRHTSSASYSTSANTVLTIGGVSGTFTSTTLADPDAHTTVFPPARVTMRVLRRERSVRA